MSEGYLLGGARLRSRVASAPPPGKSESHVLGVVYGLVDQRHDVVVIQVVDHRSSVALAGHQTQLAKHAQLVGNRRPLHVDMVGELEDRCGALPKASKDEHSARGGQRMHGCRDTLGGLRIYDRPAMCLWVGHGW